MLPHQSETVKRNDVKYRYDPICGQMERQSDCALTISNAICITIKELKPPTVWVVQTSLESSAGVLIGIINAPPLLTARDVRAICQGFRVTRATSNPVENWRQPRSDAIGQAPACARDPLEHGAGSDVATTFIQIQRL